MTSLRKRILLEGCLLFCVGLVALIYSFLPSKGTFALEGWIIFLSLLLVLAAFWLLPRFSKVLCFKKEARHKLSKAFQAAIQTPEARQQTLKKAMAILLFVLFFCRFYASHDYLENVVALKSDFMTPAEVCLSALTTNGMIEAMLFVLIEAFSGSDTLKGIVRYLSFPLTFVAFLVYPFLMQGIVGSMAGGAFSPRALLMSFELGLALGLEIQTWESPLVLDRKKLAYLLFVGAVFLILDDINDYLPKNLFGEAVGNLASPTGFNSLHRFFLYLSVILPVIYFVLLFPFDIKDRKAFLFFIAEATFFAYASIRRIETFQSVEALPLHLCNTAMYIVPLTLVFHSYGLFYFTVFVNVIGALLAMLMPNMSATNLAFSSTTFEFFTNHMYAFFMPVLIMLLGVYERPKIKYYFYSMIGFLVYFILVLFINVYQSAINRPTDFFFLNSTFIVNKLGDWAKNIYHQDFSFTANGLTYHLYPLYWFLFFLIYCGLSFAMWYVYEILFRCVNQLIELRQADTKFRKEKERYLLSGQEIERSRTMDLVKIKAAQPSLEVEGLYKKYKNATNDAVSDLSFKLSQGKIYGFLGKNGAGKSTTLKAIVGIHGYDKGSIKVCGFDTKFQPIEAKMGIGYVPDNYALYENLTGQQYIDYIASLYRVSKEEKAARLPELLSKLEMTEAYPQPISSYSHGMKQKITIIGALIHQPKIWILDEPMTGLDPNSIFQIKGMMKEYAQKGNIVFFSSHIIDVVANVCDEVIIINKGRLVETIDLTANPAKRTELEKEFLTVTASSKEEAETLIKEGA
jgi:ABC-2 type transport system ATP-binding protein